MKISKPKLDHCYYCQNAVDRDGVCTGHWDFLYKGMSNKQRMIEKRYHRDQRYQEVQRKYEEFKARKLSEREEVAA